jgi:hypothetical protein
MQQRLVVTGLEFVRTNQESVRILLDFFRNVMNRKPIEFRFTDLLAPGTPVPLKTIMAAIPD